MRRTRSTFFAGFILFAATITAHAEWKIVSANSEPGRAAVTHRHLVLENPETNEQADVDVAIFPARSCSLRIVDNPSGESLAVAMAREKAAAGVNGGYFDPDFAPIGLRINQEKVLSPLRRARLMTGVLLQSTRGIDIVRASEFPRKSKIVSAIQCGPFLVDGGKQIRGLDNSRSARRTFAAIGSGERAALGVCSDVSLSGLAELLATIRCAPDFKIVRALNLDGGSSSAFWFARENGRPFSISEFKSVRDFVALVPSQAQ